MHSLQAEELVELLHKKGIFVSHEQACKKLAEFDDDGNGPSRWDGVGAAQGGCGVLRDGSISHDASDGTTGQRPASRRHDGADDTPVGQAR